MALPRRVSRWTYDVVRQETLETPVGRVPGPKASASSTRTAAFMPPEQARAKPAPAALGGCVGSEQRGARLAAKSGSMIVARRASIALRAVRTTPTVGALVGARSESIAACASSGMLHASRAASW
jgi:hypothetical protein